MDMTIAIQKLRDSYARIEAIKKSKSANLIDICDCPKGYNKVMNTCQAVNLSGKKCVYRATSDCGRFCKRHVITESPLTKSFV